MKFNLFCILVFLSFFGVVAQEKIDFSASIETKAFLISQELPFWMYTNTNGFLNEQTNVGASAFAKANYAFNSNHSLELGLGGYYRYGSISRFDRNDLYLEYKNKWFTATAGAKSRSIVKQGLSTINNDILWTGNTRALPGFLVSNTTPFRITKTVFFNLDLGHYRLNDGRSTRKTNIHYKKIEVGYQFENGGILTAGLRHYVQWGGVTENGEELPNGIDALARVFIGQKGNGADNTNETINALGNHLGSYQLNYNLKRERVELNVYHQSLFDDRSGRELNNFPDGVWGIYIQLPKATFFKGLLYEYVQTISQSGRATAVTNGGQQSGQDNYFSNSIYQSGWTYEGRTIGLPFINPVAGPDNPKNNRSIAHHLGAITELGALRITTKLTYLQNLGTYSTPFAQREKQILSFLEVDYTTKKLGTLTLQLGADALNTEENNFAVGFGYRYFLN